VPRSPRIKGRDVASCILPPPDADTVKDYTGQQRQQQRATSHNEAHTYAPYRNGRFQCFLPRSALAASDDHDKAGAGYAGCSVTPPLQLEVQLPPLS
jgi:hypothetical protein